MKKTFCDRCGKECVAPGVVLEKKQFSGWFEIYKMRLIHSYNGPVQEQESLDLCEKCNKDLVAFLNNEERSSDT